MQLTVTRAFLIGGARQEVGSVIDVADAFGRELMQTGRAEPVTELPPQGPMTLDSTPAIVPGAELRKGKKHARKPGAG